MKKYGWITKAIIGSTVGAAALFAAVASARDDPNSKYLKWQAAKAHADARYSQFLSTGRSRDFRKWEHAEGRLRLRYSKLEKAGGFGYVTNYDINGKSTVVVTPMSTTSQDIDVSLPDNSVTSSVEPAKTEIPEDVDMNRSESVVTNDMKDNTSAEIPKNEEPEDVDMNRSDSVVTNDMKDNTSAVNPKADDSEDVDMNRSANSVVTTNDMKDNTSAVNPKTDDSEDVDMNRSANNVVTTNDMNDNTSAQNPKNDDVEDVDMNRSSMTTTNDSSMTTTNDTIDTDTSMNDNNTSAANLNNATTEDVSKNYSDNVSVKHNTTVIKTSKPIDTDKAKDTVSIGYMEGYKRGHKDSVHGHHYNDTARVYRDFPYEAPVIPSHRYKPFYVEGYKRGYEDGYNNTTKYGTVSKIGSQKGYSMYANEMNALVGVS